MNSKYFLLFLLITCFSCSKGPELTFSSENFTETQLEICNEQPCSEILIEYPKCTGDSNISMAINSAIKKYIIDALFLGDNDITSATSIEEAATDFVMAYRDYQADLPSEIDSGGYEADVSVQISLQTEGLLCLETYNYMYTGGAHGYGGSSFINIDLSTGANLTPETLFNDYDALTEVAEKAFRNKHSIPASEPINATGFWFENDSFRLPRSIGFTDDSMILIYNTYEIAPYAEGPIELKIPLEEINPLLNEALVL